VTGRVAVHVFDVDRSLRMNGTMRLLARDEWWWMSIHESLRAFVTPRARAIQDLMSDASDLLGQRTGSPSIEGYQGGADRAMAIAGAIYDAMRDRQIRYINPRASDRTARSGGQGTALRRRGMTGDVSARHRGATQGVRQGRDGQWC
jgi:hypothetical protein